MVICVFYYIIYASGYQEAALAVLSVKIDNKIGTYFWKAQMFLHKSKYIVHRHTYKSRAFIAQCTGVKYWERILFDKKDWKIMNNFSIQNTIKDNDKVYL